jgi:hypothetical protein
MAPNGTQNSDLTARQETVAVALAAGDTIADAAAKGHAGERTVKRWLAERPAFSARVVELRAEAVARATAKLADGMTLAADVLRELLDPATPGCPSWSLSGNARRRPDPAEASGPRRARHGAGAPRRCPQHERQDPCPA